MRPVNFDVKRKQGDSPIFDVPRPGDGRNEWEIELIQGFVDLGSVVCAYMHFDDADGRPALSRVLARRRLCQAVRSMSQHPRSPTTMLTSCPGVCHDGLTE
jgi:hypothetical protein